MSNKVNVHPELTLLCNFSHVNPADALQKLGRRHRCCLCYDTADDAVLRLWTTSKPPSQLRHDSVNKQTRPLQREL